MNAFPVFLASNDRYAPLVAAAIMSIAENASGKIAFHILNENISATSMKSLHRLAVRYGMPLKFCDVDVSAFRDCPAGWFRTRIIYARYVIGDMFPEYDRAIYVDADMIVLGDILEIPRLVPKEAALAACPDMGIGDFVNEKHHKQTLGISEEHTYFNNGLLLLNCEKWRDESIASALFKIAHEKTSLLRCPSQDPMNIYFSPNQYFLLPQKFNYMPSYGGGAGLADVKPAVIHFTQQKPWENPSDTYAAIYWRYSMRGPFVLENVRRYFLTSGSRLRSAIRRLTDSRALSQKTLK